jgi:serine/threonine-protein kinase RsbT
MVRLRGAETVIVGIQPEVAFTMVQLGMTLEGVATALNLEEGFFYTRRDQLDPAERLGAIVNDVRVPISSDLDLVRAREEGRVLAGQLGFAKLDLTLISTAISELARNIVRYARHGEIVLRPIQDGAGTGIVIIAQDEGPGILDVNRAMQQGYSTSGGLGLGLPGVRRIMDKFEIVSEIDHGTVITVTKWRR